MFGPPSIDEVKLQAVLEFDENSPRLRLSIITYLLENGALGFYDGDMSDLLEAADEALDYITESVPDFLVAVEAAQIVPDESGFDEDGNDEPENGSGYSYL